MQPLNIVHLIETNPITKLTNDYNNKFLTKIQENFTEMEQQLFISSCYCYLNYNQTTDFVIDLDNIWKWLGFNTKQNAKTLLEKKFVTDKDYKILLMPSHEQKTNIITKSEEPRLLSHVAQQKKGSGGHNKETIMLTIKTFKLFCLKAETKKAEQIHEYYVKLEEMLQEVIYDESNELKLQLDEAKNEIIKIEETNTKELNKKISKEREQFLLREFGTIGSMVYIIKVKSHDNGTYVIKIGESRIGIQSRYNEHKSKYVEVLLLDCFAVKKSKDFEHSHEDIKFNRVTDLSGHENERELFLVGKKLSYKTILHIINTNIKQFNDYNEFDLEKLKQENDTLKQVIATSSQPHTPHDNIIIQELLQGQKEMMKLIQNLEKSNKDILEKLNTLQTKTTTNFNQPLVTVGPRLQQINPDNMILNKVYESVAECLKEYNFKVKRPSIIKAINENTVYYGFRWAYVERDKDPNVITHLDATKPTKIQNIGYIAKLNKEKTEILNVYIDRKTASINNGYSAASSLDTPVKNGALTNGNYYVLLDKCSDELKQCFIEKYGEPLLYKDGIGQFTHTNELIRKFTCKFDSIKQLQISDKTLAKVLDKPILYNNYYFKSIGSKLTMV